MAKPSLSYASFHGGLAVTSYRWKLLGLEMKEKTHASSPSTSGKTHEKTSVIQTRRLQFDV